MRNTAFAVAALAYLATNVVMINSLRYDKMTTFRDKFRNVDVLLIDDIQFLAQKERTQEEFFHTFNALHESMKQIVIASDRSPKELAEIEDRLRSRSSISASSFGERSLAITICFIDSCSALNVWKNSSWVRSFCARNWMSSIRRTSTLRNRSRNDVILS